MAKNTSKNNESPGLNEPGPAPEEFDLESIGLEGDIGLNHDDDVKMPERMLSDRERGIVSLPPAEGELTTCSCPAKHQGPKSHVHTMTAVSPHGENLSFNVYIKDRSCYAHVSELLAAATAAP